MVWEIAAHAPRSIVCGAIIRSINVGELRCQLWQPRTSLHSIIVGITTCKILIKIWWTNFPEGVSDEKVRKKRLEIPETGTNRDTDGFSALDQRSHWVSVKWYSAKMASFSRHVLSRCSRQSDSLAGENLSHPSSCTQFTMKSLRRYYQHSSDWQPSRSIDKEEDWAGRDNI